MLFESIIIGPPPFPLLEEEGGRGFFSKTAPGIPMVWAMGIAPRHMARTVGPILLSVEVAWAGAMRCWRVLCISCQLMAKAAALAAVWGVVAGNIIIVVGSAAVGGGESMVEYKKTRNGEELKGRCFKKTVAAWQARVG
jgi:hypothetical protein